MKHEKLSQALNEVRDQYIEEAAKKNRRSYAPWVGAVAAVLALVILAGIFLRPHSPQNPATNLEVPLPPLTSTTPPLPITTGLPKYQLARPKYPIMLKRPADDMFAYDAYEAWQESANKIHNQPLGYRNWMTDYFKTITPAILEYSDSANPVCSPTNIYIALAMLAETADGETREELLRFLGIDTIEELRTLAGYIWNGHYWNDGVTTSILGNSLWLDDQYTFNSECANILAQYYYASSFSGNLESEEMTSAFRAWLNEQTGGLLEDQVNAMGFNSTTALALCSTIYYKANWDSGFIETSNDEKVFYGKEKTVTTTFMNKTEDGEYYYWGDNFSAVSLQLENRSTMWFILPDEGVETNKVLQSSNLWSMLFTQYENKKEMQINLSVPKFKTNTSLDLKELLSNLGLSNAMGNNADFSKLCSHAPLSVSGISHAATVEINEEGVAAAAFTDVVLLGAAPPAEYDEIDFVLDRPFIFIIQSSDGLPLFAGVVNQL